MYQINTKYILNITNSVKSNSAMMKLKRKLKTGPVWNPLLSLNTLRVLYHLTLIFSILFIVADTNIFSLSLSPAHLSGLLHYRQILHRLNHHVESIRIVSSKILGYFFFFCTCCKAAKYVVSYGRIFYHLL